ncbi:MAG TPA: hypothetical protein VEG66_00910, partial [Thermoplasmata archaeon]|nr:hypothetical protein [Thermoplasmata archaeon]
MAMGSHRPRAAKGSWSFTVLVAALVFASAMAVPALSSTGQRTNATLLAPALFGSPARPTIDASHPVEVPETSAAAPGFSAGSIGEVSRTIFPGFNTTLAGSFTSSVATWSVGTPAYVPTTNTLWFPQRAVPVAGDPVPSVAPAAVFNVSTGEFDRLDTNLSNA